jgi:hypothetical protein
MRDGGAAVDAAGPTECSTCCVSNPVVLESRVPNIFISYRRDDAEAEARLLANALKAHFGSDSVFFDRSDIAVGVRYPKVLQEQLGASDVHIAVNGRDWVRSRDGIHRLEGEHDWVRHELTVGLRRQIRVVPVLVKNATVPLAADLPAAIRELASCQALSARGESWDADVARLLEQLSPLASSRHVFASREPSGFAPYSGEEWRDELNPLLERVRAVYIDGVLAAAQRDGRFVGIETEDVPDAVEQIARRRVEITEQPPETISRGMAFIRIYDRAAKSLLVLGEPGCGKTIALLELARDLIQRAEGNTGAPVPVVFRLSAWGQKQGDFAAWLVGELQGRYQVPSRIGRKLLEQRRLALLLDGLDEVGGVAQAASVAAINGYLERFGAAGVAVTCRYREYTMMTARLHLFGAIFIRPLSQRDVETYLADGGSDLASLLSAVKADEALLSLARVPLFLLLMTVASRSQKARADAQPIGVSSDALKSAVCNRYIEARLASTAATRSTRPCMPMLISLATAMHSTGQTECHIEYLQPSWLTRTERLVWFLSSRIAAFGVFLAAIVTVDLGFSALLQDSAEFRRTLDYFLATLGPSVGVGLASAVYVGVLGFTGTLGPKHGWRKRTVAAATVALVYVLLLVLGIRAMSWMGDWNPFAGPYGPLFVTLYLLRTLRPKVQDEIAPAEKLTWSWRHALRRGSLAFAAGAVLSGFLWTELSADALSSDAAVANAVVQGVIAGLLASVVLATLLAIAFSGVTTSILLGKMRPNEGVLLSLRNSLLTWLLAIIWGVVGAYGLLAAGAVFGDQEPLPRFAEVRVLLDDLPDVAAFVAFNLGALDVLHHYTLRVLLAIRRRAPLRLAEFLDDGVEMGFLRRAGAGYTFLHRILLEHFAALASSHALEADQRMSAWRVRARREPG